MRTYLIGERVGESWLHPRVREAPTDAIAWTMTREIADRLGADMRIWEWRDDGTIRPVGTVVLVRHPDGRRAKQAEIEALIR